MNDAQEKNEIRLAFYGSGSIAQAEALSVILKYEKIEHTRVPGPSSSTVVVISKDDEKKARRALEEWSHATFQLFRSDGGSVTRFLSPPVFEVASNAKEVLTDLYTAEITKGSR